MISRAAALCTVWRSQAKQESGCYITRSRSGPHNSLVLRDGDPLILSPQDAPTWILSAWPSVLES